MSADLSLYSPANVNRLELFFLFQHLGGELERVAAAKGLPLDLVRSIAHDDDWDGKLPVALRGDKDVKVELHRARAAHQAHRLQTIMGKVMDKIEQDVQTDAGLSDLLVKRSKEGVEVTAKVFVEIAKALEVSHQLMYRALGDTPKAGTGDKPTAEDSPEALQGISVAINKLVLNAAQKAVREPIVVHAVEASADPGASSAGPKR